MSTKVSRRVDPTDGCLSQTECAARLGISRQAVEYHEAKALKKLKALLAAKFGKDLIKREFDR